MAKADGLRGAWWWIDRWRKSSAYMDFTLAQQGAYRNLIDEAWLRGGVLPDDERTLARASGDPLEWPDMRDRVMAKFYRVEDGWRHSTVDEVMGKSGDLREKRATAGRKGFANVTRGEKGHFAGKNGLDGQLDGQIQRSEAGNGAGKHDGQTTAYPSPSPSPVAGSRTPDQEQNPPYPPPDAGGEVESPSGEVSRPAYGRLLEETNCPACDNRGTIRGASAGRGYFCGTKLGGCGQSFDLAEPLILDQLTPRAREAILRRLGSDQKSKAIPPPPKVDPAVVAAENELYAKRHDLASEFLAWYRLHPLAGIFEGRAGMHSVAFGAWPRSTSLPSSLADVVRKEAMVLLEKAPEPDEPSDPSKPHHFQPDLRMRAKAGRDPLCWCAQRAEHPLHGAA